jgi:hypothetical protein
MGRTGLKAAWPRDGERLRDEVKGRPLDFCSLGFKANAGQKGIFLYLICHDFRKIIGRTKILHKYTSGAVAHGAWSSCRHGPRR